MPGDASNEYFLRAMLDSPCGLAEVPDFSRLTIRVAGFRSTPLLRGHPREHSGAVVHRDHRAR